MSFGPSSLRIWPVTPDWVGNVLTAVGVIASVGLVLYQLGRQHSSSLKLQRSNAKDELKLKIYESLIAKARAAMNASNEAISYARSIPWEIESRRFREADGVAGKPTTLRAEELSRLHYKSAGKLVELIFEIEKWEIAFKAGPVFRYAFSAANHDAGQALHPFYTLALRLLPVDLAEHGLHVPPSPSDEVLEELKEKFNAYSDAETTVVCYITDLVTESQNLLLSKLFKRRLSPRKPLDPQFKVITLQDAPRLIEYFRTQTDAGKRMREAENRVRRNLAARNEAAATQ